MRMDADREESGYDGHYDVPDDDYGYDDAPDEREWGPDDSGAYWRRRFLILCGGVAALGVCAWLFPGAHHPTAQAAAAARASVAAADRQQALPPAALGSPWSAPAAASPSAVPSAAPSPSATGSPATAAKKTKKKKQKISLAYRPWSTSAAAPAATPGAACKPADIVLSLFTGQSSYAPGARPSFRVYAVSTASAPCTLPYGAGAVQVVVTRHGQVVWDSAACKPAPAKRVRFTAGVPQVLKLIWNPAAARPAGCAGALAAGATGTLDAVALDGGQSSPVRSFKIKR
jgi:hypothetical protein